MKRLVKCAVVAAIYVLLTVLLEPISFGPIQFRFAEILMCLCIYKFDYVIALTLGCAISNIFSPYGLMDFAFGTLATFLAGLSMYFVKKKLIVWIFPALFNGFIVGLEITILGDFKPFITWYFINNLEVMASEIILIIIGLFIFSRLEKNSEFMTMIRGNEDEGSKEDTTES